MKRLSDLSVDLIFMAIVGVVIGISLMVMIALMASSIISDTGVDRSYYDDGPTYDGYIE